MKKLLVTLLAVSMSFSLIACGDGKTENKETQATESTQTESKETTVESKETTESVVESTQPEESKTPDDESVTDTIGNALGAQFHKEIEETPDITTEEMATFLISNPVLGDEFNAMTMPVEPGLLNGFDNAEITGFSEATMFAPMIGAIPFIGYVFSLDADADVDAFVANLESNANPRWNICTEADETVIEKSGNMVFFLMCPKSLDEE